MKEISMTPSPSELLKSVFNSPEKVVEIVDKIASTNKYHDFVDYIMQVSGFVKDGPSLVNENGGVWSIVTASNMPVFYANSRNGILFIGDGSIDAYNTMAKKADAVVRPHYVLERPLPN